MTTTNKAKAQTRIVAGEALTPNQAWEGFIGSESPREWSVDDVAVYVNNSPVCEDLDRQDRDTLALLLVEHISANTA